MLISIDGGELKETDLEKFNIFSSHPMGKDEAALEPSGYQQTFHSELTRALCF